MPSGCVGLPQARTIPVSVYVVACRLLPGAVVTLFVTGSGETLAACRRCVQSKSRRPRSPWPAVPAFEADGAEPARRSFQRACVPHAVRDHRPSQGSAEDDPGHVACGDRWVRRQSCHGCTLSEPSRPPGWPARPPHAGTRPAPSGKRRIHGSRSPASKADPMWRNDAMSSPYRPCRVSARRNQRLPSNSSVKAIPPWTWSADSPTWRAT